MPEDPFVEQVSIISSQMAGGPIYRPAHIAATWDLVGMKRICAFELNVS